MAGLSIECQDSAGSCERNQCECDAKFYADLIHLSLTGVQYDFQYSGAVFDSTKKCKKLETRIRKRSKTLYRIKKSFAIYKLL